ncbi:MAG: hypothetical protein RQ859_01020 [Pyrobaculum sp.]|nr:hypothetical protein [Pyrobaculum sp.]
MDSMEVVNVVMTCKKVLRLPEDAPTELLDHGTKYYLLGEDVVATVFNTGKVKVYAKSWPPPPLPYFGDCKVDNIVIRTRVKALPAEELVAALDALGFKFGDLEKVNAFLFYYKKGNTTATIRIFPKTGVEEYKAMIFTKFIELAEEVVRLLKTL